MIGDQLSLNTTGIKPDGQALDQIAGFRPPDEFLKEALVAMKGNALANIEAKIAAAENPSPQLVFEYARVLARKERYDQAFKQLEQVMKANSPEDGKPNFDYYRSIRQIHQMSRKHPPAKEFLDKQYADLDSKIRAMTTDKNDARKMLHFNSALRKRDRNLQIFDLYYAKQKDHPIAEMFFSSSYRSLLDAKRFDDILVFTTPEEQLEQAEEFVREQEEWLAGESEDKRKQLGEIVKKSNIGFLASVYQLNMGLKRNEVAGQLVKKILEKDQSAETYNKLAWSAYLSGSPTAESLDHARRAYELTGGKNAEIIDTLAHVLNSLGQKGEALKLLDDAEARLESEKDRKILAKARKDIEDEVPSKTKP